MHQAIQKKGWASTQLDPSSPAKLSAVPTAPGDTLPAIQSLLDALRQVISNLPVEEWPGLSLHRAVRAKEVMQMTGDKRSHFYARLNAKSPSHDPTFPRPFRLGTSARAPTVWWAHEILAWLQTRAISSRKH